MLQPLRYHFMNNKTDEHVYFGRITEQADWNRLPGTPAQTRVARLLTFICQDLAQT